MDQHTKDWLLSQKEYFEIRLKGCNQKIENHLAKMRATGKQIRRVRKEKEEYNKTLVGIHQLLIDQEDWEV